MATQNKLFTSGMIPDNSQVSKIRQNREYLLSENVAHDLNTYLNFGIFKTFNDVYTHKYNEKTGAQEFDKKGGDGPGTPGVRSIFNRAGAVLVGTSSGAVSEDDITGNASEIRISNNVPLMDSPENRQRIRENSNCTVKSLVEASSKGLLGRSIYSYADFMYCKHLGKISNNHLITLRRFPVPVGDFISALGVGKTRLNEGKNLSGQQIGCMITWMGTPGNEMTNLLKYNYSMPFKEIDAKWNNIEGGQADSNPGVLNGIAAAFDPTYRKQFMSGHGGAQYEQYGKYMNKFYNKATKDTWLGKHSEDPFDRDFFKGPYDARYEMNWRDENKVYGPIDRVKKTYMRSEDGIQFNQTFSITFDYELRSYNGINGKQAMLDLLSNILNVTYTTGDFWGGGYIGAGQHQNSIFTNMQMFKGFNGFSGFIDKFMQDCSTVTKSVGDSLKNMDFLTAIKTTLNQLGGMIMAGFLNKLGRPEKIFASSLLSEQPVGLWHLTIGNPFHPIISVGNLVLKNTIIEHYGPLGLDDFPTGIRVTCELERGKPRDIREIEKMYMHGNDKIYYSMGPKVLDMYKASEAYQKRRQDKISESSSNNMEIPTGRSKVVKENNSFTSVLLKNNNKSDIVAKRNIIKSVFGDDDTYSITMTAKEQDFGSQPRKTTQK